MWPCLCGKTIYYSHYSSSLFIFSRWTVLLEMHTDRECSGTIAVLPGKVFCGKKTLKRMAMWITVSNWETWLKKRNNGETDLFVYNFAMFSCLADQFSSRVAASVHLTSCVMLNQFLKRQLCETNCALQYSHAELLKTVWCWSY